MEGSRLRVRAQAILRQALIFFRTSPASARPLDPRGLPHEGALAECFCPRLGSVLEPRRSAAPWPPGATVGLCWVAVWYRCYFPPLFPSIFFLILFLVELGDGVQSRFIENPSVHFMKCFSESGLLEMNGCPQLAAQNTHDTNGTCIWSHLFPTSLECL